MRQKVDTVLYVIFDFVSAGLAWGLFFVFRKKYIEAVFLGQPLIPVYDQKLFWGLTIIPTFWVILHALMGVYNDVYRKSRLNELGRTIGSTALGVTLLFFLVILDDNVMSYKTYYKSVLVLYALTFTLTFFFRFILLTDIARRYKIGKIKFNTLLIGSNGSALNIVHEIKKSKYPLGYDFKGFVNKEGVSRELLSKEMPCLGKIENIPDIIRNHAIQEVIIALDHDEHPNFKNLIDLVRDEGVIIKIIPTMYDIILGHVKMQQIFGAILIEVYPEIIPAWQKVLKRAIDISASFFALMILSFFMLYIAIRVRMSSKGPIIYKQERIGRRGKPFNILKFRSMYPDAEVKGPALSSENDPRITPWGAIMRKWRLDEFPQFINVLKGEMSLVGPRPERRFYIDKITEVAPHYKHLLKVKPGITSWGQVKYGYAENVTQMVDRLKFDILYIENMSILVDFKIMFYTLQTLFEGKGK